MLLFIMGDVLEVRIVFRREAGCNEVVFREHLYSFFVKDILEVFQLKETLEC